MEQQEQTIGLDDNDNDNEMMTTDAFDATRVGPSYGADGTLDWSTLGGADTSFLLDGRDGEIGAEKGAWVLAEELKSLPWCSFQISPSDDENENIAPNAPSRWIYVKVTNNKTPTEANHTKTENNNNLFFKKTNINNKQH